MTLRSWGEATAYLAVAAVALYLAMFPAFSVVYALSTDANLFARLPQAVALVVAVGGTYPFVADDWSYRRLVVFVIALYVASGAAGLAGLALLYSYDIGLPSTTVARAGALAVAYPVAFAAAFRDRVRRRLGFRPVDATETEWR